MTTYISKQILINNALLLFLLTFPFFCQANQLSNNNIFKNQQPECSYYYNLDKAISNIQKENEDLTNEYHLLYISSIKDKKDVYLDYISKLMQITKIPVHLSYFCEVNSFALPSKIILIKSNKVLYYKNIPNDLEPLSSIKRVFNELIYAQTLYETSNEIGKILLL